MINISHKEIKFFQKKILDWYQNHQRDLPWRQTKDPYYILVSEVMSQQTQIGRVVPKYEAWIRKFPTVESLAKASITDVLQYWSGLGYNRRALNLQKTATIIVSKYHGKFPDKERILLELPGIGEYTARALLCFAFNKQVVVVDTNVRRVIMTQIQNSKFKMQNLKEKELYAIAELLLPHGKAKDWNQALMDYAAAELKKEKILPRSGITLRLTRQSKFIGSHRYYRGQILKKLLEKQTIPLTEIGTIIKKDFSEKEKDWLQKLINELAQEGFIMIQQGMVRLAS